MLQRAHFDYGVRARPGESLSLEEMRAKVPSIFAEQPHESRSSRYVYLPTHEIMTHLMANNFLPVEVRHSRVRDESKRGYNKHMVKLRQELQTTARALGDLSFEVILRGSHDGTSTWDLFAGINRLICLNGCVVWDSTFADIKVRHTGNREKQLNEIIEGAYSVLDAAPRVMETPKLWSQIELNRDERMVLAEAAHTVRFGDANGETHTPIKPEQLLIPRRPADQGDDLWSTYNVLQENTTRGGVTAMGYDANNRPRRTTTREVRGIDQDVKLNRAIWQITAKMAELKTA